jgi:hypothetical protein
MGNPSIPWIHFVLYCVYAIVGLFGIIVCKQASITKRSAEEENSKGLNKRLIPEYTAFTIISHFRLAHLCQSKDIRCRFLGLFAPGNSLGYHGFGNGERATELCSQLLL